MRRLLAIAMTLGYSACYQPPDTRTRGVSFWQHAAVKVPRSDIATTVRTAIEYTRAPAGVFVDRGLWVDLVDGPLPCPDRGDMECADLVWSDCAEVVVASQCLADGALLHMLTHAILDRVEEDRDDHHERTATWTFVDGVGRDMLRSQLEGCPG